MFDKLKTYLRRIKTMSFKRMYMYAKKAGREFKKPVLFVLADMVFSSFKYSIGYLDHLTFGFAGLDKTARATFMTMVDNQRLIRRLNDKALSDLFEDKERFLERFTDYVRRDFLDLEKASFGDFETFVSRHSDFFAKEKNNYGGLGVSRIEVGAKADIKELYDRLVESKRFLVEETVSQHPEMSRLFPLSVNTIRVVTVLKDGEATVMYALVRMGSGISRVDNISSGGMYSPLDESGVISAPAFCDKTGEYYDVHPTSGTPLVGFKIPMYDKGIDLVKRAALEIPEVRYVGWDVAIAKDGPLIIEGNTVPSYDMCQNHKHLKDPRLGVKPRFKELLGDEF